MFCRDKHMFAATNIILSRQSFAHIFVVTKNVFCRDTHVFVATRIRLVAAPANDTRQVAVVLFLPVSVGSFVLVYRANVLPQ